MIALELLFQLWLIRILLFQLHLQLQDFARLQLGFFLRLLYFHSPLSDGVVKLVYSVFDIFAGTLFFDFCDLSFFYGLVEPFLEGVERF